MVVVCIGFEIRLKNLFETDIEKQYNFTLFSTPNHDIVCTNIENGGRYEAQTENIPLAASFMLTL